MSTAYFSTRLKIYKPLLAFERLEMGICGQFKEGKWWIFSRGKLLHETHVHNWCKILFFIESSLNFSLFWLRSRSLFAKVNWLSDFL